MLYVKLRKALYGTLQAVLLFWRLFSNTLIEWGFKHNNHDKCVMSKTINGKQCMIIWHVYDLKISHVYKKVVENIIDNDSMVQVLWTRHFLAAKGDYIPTTTIYQNNKSIIMLVEKGEKSSCRYTRHLNVRFFLSQTRLKKVK